MCVYIWYEGRMCSGVAAAIGWPQRCLEHAKVRNPLNLNNASSRTLVFFKKIARNAWLFLLKSVTLQPLTNQSPAEIAQLVEHNLAKVRVASSSLVFRSRSLEWWNR